MALIIKDRGVERLAASVAALTGETKTQTIRRAIEERTERLTLDAARKDRRAEMRHFLERTIWPNVPKRLCGLLTRKEDGAQST